MIRIVTIARSEYGLTDQELSNSIGAHLSEGHVLIGVFYDPTIMSYRAITEEKEVEQP